MKKKSLILSFEGKGMVSEPENQAQEAETGRRDTRAAAEEKGKPAREPLESSYSAGQRGRHRRNL